MPKTTPSQFRNILTACGNLTPREAPPITSSSLDQALKDPFGWFLTNRLGLQNGLYVSKALSRGSWLHKRFELMNVAEPLRSELWGKAVAARMAELRLTHTAYGLDNATATIAVERETRDSETSRAWYEAVKDTVIPSGVLGYEGLSFERFLTLPRFTILGSEIVAVARPGVCAPIPLVATFDKLVYDSVRKELWIVDLKSFDGRPITRLSIAPCEFQTKHYLFILNHLIQKGIIQKKFDLPADTKVGGMTHIVIQKPTINFDKRVDRPFRFVEKVLSRGPRKGQTIHEKEYLSEEPQFDLYLQRVSRWYRGEGEYEGERVERIEHSPVNCSFSHFKTTLDDDGTAQYLVALKHMHNLSVAEVALESYIQNSKELIVHGELSSLSPFYLLPPNQWPTMIRHQRLVQSFRYSFVGPETVEGIYAE